MKIPKCSCTSAASEFDHSPLRDPYSYGELWQPKSFLVVFRMYQLNFNNNPDFVYKKYWNMYADHFVETL